MNKMIARTVTLVILTAGVLAPATARAVTLSVPSVDAGLETVRVASPGATTAVTVGGGNYVVGPAGGPLPLDRWQRAIPQFPTSDFASIVGLPLVSATLHYNIVSDFLEPGETGSSQVRLFTTTETDLNLGNRDVYAGLSGDGGAHTTIGVAPWSDGVVGPQSLPFSAAGLGALFSAINGSDPTIGVAFREFNVSTVISFDTLDEIVLGLPPGNFVIEVDALPEPATATLVAFAGLFALRRRRR